MLPFLLKEEPALSILDCLCHVSYLIRTIHVEVRIIEDNC